VAPNEPLIVVFHLIARTVVELVAKPGDEQVERAALLVERPG
jgi:hypothetical protein